MSERIPPAARADDARRVDPLAQLGRSLAAEARQPLPPTPGVEDTMRTLIATLAHMLDDHDRSKRSAA